jgi:hypothetical protein
MSLAADMSKTIDAIAVSRRVSVDRAIVDLLSDAIETYELRRITFFELADRLQQATDQSQIERLRNELAEMTFGV